MAECPRRVALAGPVGRFRIPDLKAQPPVIGPLHTVPGQYTVQAGKLHRGRVGMHLRRDRRWTQQITREHRQVRDRRGRPEPGGSGAPVQPGGHHAQGFAHRLGQVAPELDPRLPLHALGQHGETVVRIHPAGAGAGQRLIGMHRQPRCVRQQVTDRGAGRACRGVEIHHPLLNGDLCGSGHQRLGDRRQREHPRGIAVGG